MAFSLLAVAGPGIMLQRLARVAVDPALVLPLGLAFTAGAFWVSLAAHASWLFPVLVCLVLLGPLVVFSGPRGSGPAAAWRLAAGPSLRGALAPMAVLVALLALTQYPGNRFSDTGGVPARPVRGVRYGVPSG